MFDFLTHVSTPILIVGFLLLLLIPMAIIAISKTKREYMDRDQ